MLDQIRNVISSILVIFLAVGFVPEVSADANHIVSSSELHQTLLDSSRTRTANVRSIEKFFAREEVQQVLKANQLDSQQITRAVGQLSDDELAQLAVRSQKAQNDISGGVLTNRELTWIVIGLAFVILLIAIAD